MKLKRGASRGEQTSPPRVGPGEKRPDTRSDDEKKAIIGDRMRQRAQVDALAAADAAIRSAVERETGAPWDTASADIAATENIDIADVPAYLRSFVDVTYVDI